jgi:Fur family peroxide stress response transcriptional regulator
MKVETQELKSRMHRFEEAFKQAGLKRTHQRMEIFREVAGSGDHPDVEKIYRTVRRRIPTVSLDTVYRTLWLFLDLGLITTLGPTRERTRFDANVKSHHHFICSRCGLTSDFYDDGFDRLKVPEEARKLGSAEKIHVEVSGICMRCQEKK